MIQNGCIREINISKYLEAVMPFATITGVAPTFIKQQQKI